MMMTDLRPDLNEALFNGWRSQHLKKREWKAEMFAQKIFNETYFFC